MTLFRSKRQQMSKDTKQSSADLTKLHAGKFIKITDPTPISGQICGEWYGGKITLIQNFPQFARIQVEKSTIGKLTQFDTDIWNIEIMDIDEMQFRLLCSG